MINEQLINPSSIAVIGGSNDVKKPGGKILKNLIDGKFKGSLYVVNPHETTVQGVPCFNSVESLPPVDLAILAIPAQFCHHATSVLINQNETRAFIVLSAGFGEAGEKGKALEKELLDLVNSANACLIGPNCIGVLNYNYHGVFTTPIPKLDPQACDLISNSGATAVFIMEAGIPLGVKFSNVYSIGNAAQIGVEEVLEYMDQNFDLETSPTIKLLYIEAIREPAKFLKHASSLVRKGAKLAAIKAGTSVAGNRAASSHTGAIATSNMAVRALFEKAGVVYCSSRKELISVASIFKYKKPTGKNFAIITHAGGSAVMLADALSEGGLNVPQIDGPDAEKLLAYLNHGSSVNNPIDFLATGTADQLSIIIDYCEHKFSQIDAMVVVFGSPGLFDVENVYNVLSVKLDMCTKPIYPVLPSVLNAHREIEGFLKKGNINFPDEVVLGRALSATMNTVEPAFEEVVMPEIDCQKIRLVIDNSADGYLNPESVSALLDACGINRAPEILLSTAEQLGFIEHELTFPIVMKVVGPLHKTDVSGVVLNINSVVEVRNVFERLINIPETKSVMIQPMLSGVELFLGVNYEAGFGRLIVCGLGGIFIEVLHDVSAAISPVSSAEAHRMIERLKGYSILKGLRGREGVDIDQFAVFIQKVSALTQCAPEIMEMDINPLIGNSDRIVAVDARIRIKKIH